MCKSWSKTSLYALIVRRHMFLLNCSYPVLQWHELYLYIRKFIVIIYFLGAYPGPGCSKLTTLLVNIWLKFQKLVSSNTPIFFCWKKCEKLFALQKLFKFFQQKISMYLVKVVKHITSWPPNELVKLMILWTTGPWIRENERVQRTLFKVNGAPSRATTLPFSYVMNKALSG